MMTQCLLTLGAIPAISVDTPHYPAERQRRGCLEEMQDRVVHTYTTCTSNLVQCAAETSCYEPEKEEREKRTTATLKCEKGGGRVMDIFLPFKRCFSEG